MTREEQIANAASKYIYDDDGCLDPQYAFEDGAKWADTNRWVKVEPGCELPPVQRYVLMYFPLYNNIFMHYLKKDGTWDVDPLDGQGEPSHWTHLPSPPKAEQ